jgi:hypothetical protein
MDTAGTAETMGTDDTANMAELIQTEPPKAPPAIVFSKSDLTLSEAPAPTIDEYREYRDLINTQAISLFTRMAKGNSNDFDVEFFVKYVMPDMPRSHFEVPSMVLQYDKVEGGKVYKIQTNEQGGVPKLEFYKRSGPDAKKVDLETLRTQAYWVNLQRESARSDIISQIAIYNAYDWAVQMQSASFAPLPEYYMKRYTELDTTVTTAVEAISKNDPLQILTTTPFRVQVLSVLNTDKACLKLATQIKAEGDYDEKTLIKTLKAKMGCRNMLSLLALPRNIGWWLELVQESDFIVYKSNGDHVGYLNMLQLYMTKQVQQKYKALEKTKSPAPTPESANERKIIAVLKRGYQTCLADRIRACSDGTLTDEKCLNLPQQCLQSKALLDPMAQILNSMSVSNKDLFKLVGSLYAPQYVKFPDLDVVPPLMPSNTRAELMRGLQRGNGQFFSTDGEAMTRKKAKEYLREKSKNESNYAAKYLVAEYPDMVQIEQVPEDAKKAGFPAPIGRLRNVSTLTLDEITRGPNTGYPGFPLGNINADYAEQKAKDARKESRKANAKGQIKGNDEVRTRIVEKTASKAKLPHDERWKKEITAKEKKRANKDAKAKRLADLIAKRDQKQKAQVTPSNRAPLVKDQSESESISEDESEEEDYSTEPEEEMDEAPEEDAQQLETVEGLQAANQAEQDTAVTTGLRSLRKSTPVTPMKGVTPTNASALVKAYLFKGKQSTSQDEKANAEDAKAQNIAQTAERAAKVAAAEEAEAARKKQRESSRNKPATRAAVDKSVQRYVTRFMEGLTKRTPFQVFPQKDGKYEVRLQGYPDRTVYAETQEFAKAVKSALDDAMTRSFGPNTTIRRKR